MESPLFRAKGGWKEMHAIAWASTVIFDNVEKIVDQIQRNGNLVKLSQVLEDMPQTEILLTAILQNLSPLVLDVVDIVSMKPIHLVSFFFLSFALRSLYYKPLVKFSSLESPFFSSPDINSGRLQIAGGTMAVRRKGKRRCRDGTAIRHP